METQAQIGSEAMGALLLDGMCVALDHFQGAVPFKGTVRRDGRNAVDTRGELTWYTRAPSTGAGERGVALLLIEREGPKGEWVPNGNRKSIDVNMDFDSIRKLYGCDDKAEDELLEMVMGHSEHFSRYDIRSRRAGT